MREILFRGKYKDTWMKGGFIQEYFTEQKYQPIIFVINENQEMEYYKVDFKTIGQYTGLKDKKGNKIFEGDILFYDGDPCPYCNKAIHDSSRGNYIVEWEQDSCWFTAKSETNFLTSDIWNTLEIIGNIHDKKDVE